MTGQQALKIFDRLLEQNQLGKLKDTQSVVLLQVYEGKSYREIGKNLGYEPDYIKQIAANLWQMLSGIAGEKVTKSNIKSILRRYELELNSVDWGEAIDVSRFYGRTTELETLKDWIIDSRCRLVGIFGWGGIGKTALSVKLAQQLESQFDFVVWRSLQQAPTTDDLLNEILPILTGSDMQESSFTLLMEQFRQKRCLLVLDNVESILQAGNRSGLYLAGYEAYGQMCARVSDEIHQSCVVITGREKPNGMTLREGADLPVRSWQLGGLPIEAAQQILTDKGITASVSDQKNLINYANGSPLTLKLLATNIKNLFGGDVQTFLAQGTAVFSNLWDLLHQQFARLSVLQQQVMYWLAINREGVVPARLKAEILLPVTLTQILETLETLRDRSLIETTARGLTQQPVIMEYITEHLIRQIEQEIISGELNLFKTHALIEAQTQDYLRDAQIQLILQPLVDRLSMHFASQDELEQHLYQIIGSLRHQSIKETGYAGGNLLNLFCHLKTELEGFDFSYLVIRQAYLLNAMLHEVDFTGSHLSQTIFAETFGGVVGIAFSPNGKCLATSDTKGDIQIWNSLTLEKLTHCQGHQHWTWSVEFSPDGQYLASASDDYKVKLWDVATGECLYTYIGHTYSVNTVTFSPDGTMIASSSQDGTVRLWRVTVGKLNPAIQVLTGHSGRVWAIAFSPDGKNLISGGEDSLVRLWDLATGDCLTTWEAHTDWVRSVDFSPDGRSVVTGSHDRTSKIWDVATQECLQVLQGHQHFVSKVAFSPDGQQIISGSYDRTIKLWDFSTGKCLKTFLGHRSRVWNVAFHPNGERIASGGDDHTTKIWSLKLGRCINTITGYTNAVLSVVASPDGNYVASGHEDRTIRVWDVQTGRVTETMLEHTNRVWSVRFSPDGHTLASGSADYLVKLWDWQLGECLQTFRGHTSWVWKVVFSPNGQILASSSYDQTVKTWDIATGECLQTLSGHGSPVVSVAFSTDSRIIASSDFSGKIKLWDAAAGDCYQDLQEHTNSVWSIAFSSDNQWLVSASYDKTLRLWSLASGECVRTFTGHQGAVLQVQFSPDNRSVISAGLDRTIKIWDIESGECLQTLAGHSGLIYAMDLATSLESNQQYIYTGSLDETIKRWDLAAANCLATWKIRRPYEGMKIDKMQGLTDAQKSTLKALGAIVSNKSH
jgi:WD40 repeat protein/DNA-binding CsgD family transcriptional regulator